MKNFVLSYQKDLPDGNFISIKRSFKGLKSLLSFLNYEFPNIDDVDFSIFDVSMFVDDSSDNNFKITPFNLFGGSNYDE